MEIEKLKAENDRLKLENQGSRTGSQVSISSSPPPHTTGQIPGPGLSQHSLNLSTSESTSLGTTEQRHSRNHGSLNMSLWMDKMKSYHDYQSADLLCFNVCTTRHAARWHRWRRRDEEGGETCEDSCQSGRGQQVDRGEAVFKSTSQTIAPASTAFKPVVVVFFLLQERRLRNFLIGCIGVSGKTKWDVLDGVVRRLFKVSEVQNKKTVLDPHQLFCNLRN